MSVTPSRREPIPRFASLRTRIALAYGTLFACVAIVVAVALNAALGSILLDAAKAHCLQVSDEIDRVADTNNGFGFFEELPVQAVLANQANIEHWASPTTFVQIDTPRGYPIGKSSNLGSAIFTMHDPLAADGERFSVSPSPFGRILILDRVIVSDGHPVAIVHVGERLFTIDALVARARGVLIVVTLVAIAALVIASLLVAKTAIDPIERLTAAMAEIGSDRLDRRLRWRARNDEVGKLASTFDAMLARLQEAFARERQFISDASHELKTPLTVINANAQMLARWGDRDPEVRRESLEAIIGESSSLASMVNGMLTLAKADSGDGIPKEPVDLAAVARDVVVHVRDRAAQKGLVLEARGEREAFVAGDPALLRQVVANLVDNALKFTERGSITVVVSADLSSVTLAVEDTGPGIDEDLADRLFDRFFRSDLSHSRTVEGTGLGLAIVRSIARVHDGVVGAKLRPGGGAAFLVTLPRLRTPSSSNLHDRPPPG